MKKNKHKFMNAWRNGMAVVTLACVAPAFAALNSEARLQTLAKLPDWTGIWKVEGSSDTIEPQAANAARPWRDHPPYKPEWEAKYAAARKNADQTLDTVVRYCAAGAQRLIASPYEFEIVLTPEEVLTYYSSREIRHIWTDGRAHPPADELWPLYWGDSIGHWEGQTLVIETLSMKGDQWLDKTGATLSDSARLIERISMVDKDHLKNEITFEDPVVFTKPWTFTRTYKRSASRELTEQGCDWQAGKASKSGK